MRVFHFVNEEFGLENLRRRRLKVATLNELNDPFEFLGVSLADESIRRGLQAVKNHLALKTGLLCFSRDWRNPVQWSHYAAKHEGLCLGFDVPDAILEKIRYSRTRLVVDAGIFSNSRQLDEDFVKQIFFTKYSHWRYENEVRCRVELKDKDPDKKDMYFADFSDRLQLASVIVGARSSITREALHNALGDLAPQIETFKARLAFKTFRVVRQGDSKLWL
jgi:hypothetical protein